MVAGVKLETGEVAEDYLHNNTIIVEVRKSVLYS